MQEKETSVLGSSPIPVLGKEKERKSEV